MEKNSIELRFERLINLLRSRQHQGHYHNIEHGFEYSHTAMVREFGELKMTLLELCPNEKIKDLNSNKIIVNLLEIAGHSVMAVIHHHFKIPADTSGSFDNILDHLLQIRETKGHDYGEGGNSLSNLQACEEIGISAFTGVIIRLMDKFARADQFKRTGVLKVTSEKITDTFLDITVYSLLAIMLKEKEDNLVLLISGKG